MKQIYEKFAKALEYWGITIEDIEEVKSSAGEVSFKCKDKIYYIRIW